MSPGTCLRTFTASRPQPRACAKSQPSASAFLASRLAVVPDDDLGFPLHRSDGTPVARRQDPDELRESSGETTSAVRLRNHQPNGGECEWQQRVRAAVARARRGRPAARAVRRHDGEGAAPAADRVSASLDASGTALKELRTELQKSGSTLLKDAQLRNVEKFVKDAGSGFRAVSKQLAKDLEKVQKAASGKKTTKRKSAAGSKKKSTAKRKSSSSARKSTAKRAASSAKRSAKSGAKRTKAAAKGAKSGAKRGAAGAKKKRR